MANLSPIMFARFWSKVEVQHPKACWPWRASLDRYGYGQFKGCAHVSPQRAHRVAYESINGPIDSDLVLRHTCNNPACCNPDHMVPGTQADNHNDREASGRCPRDAGRFLPITSEDAVLSSVASIV